jgi:uncharacterized protein YihD (DUF1040 family)
MRDIKRIKPFLERLEKIWSKYPDLRFGQMVINYTQMQHFDGYHIEDEEMITALENLYNIKEGE